MKSRSTPAPIAHALSLPVTGRVLGGVGLALGLPVGEPLVPEVDGDGVPVAGGVDGVPVVGGADGDVDVDGDGVTASGAVA